MKPFLITMIAIFALTVLANVNRKPDEIKKGPSASQLMLSVAIGVGIIAWAVNLLIGGAQ